MRARARHAAPQTPSESRRTRCNAIVDALEARRSHGRPVALAKLTVCQQQSNCFLGRSSSLRRRTERKVLRKRVNVNVNKEGTGERVLNVFVCVLVTHPRLVVRKRQKNDKGRQPGQVGSGDF